jgi:hypothetical protein
MKKFISLAILAGGMIACASPCEKAYDATASCLEEAGQTVDGDAESECANDDGSNDEMYECMADAYGNADCSTDAGAVAAAFSALECAGGLEGLLDTAAE